MVKKELMKHSCHSIRVWACVTLDEAGMSPDFIKNRLRWMGESYRVYLRDTNKINEKHMEALKSSAEKTVKLLDCPQEIDTEIDVIYSEMGEYNTGGIELIFNLSLFKICLAQSVFATSWCLQDPQDCVY